MNKHERMNPYMPEIRAFDFDVKAEGPTEGKRTLYGRAIVYGVRTNIGPFDEIIEPEALTNADLRDVRFLVNHNTIMIPLARSRNNNQNSTMQLSPVKEGVDIRVDLDTANNAESRALSSAVDRGDITGMSFMMVGVRSDWENLQSEHPTRHIIGIDRVLEVSACTFPAYAQTSLESRGIPGALESAQEALDSARAEFRAIERKKQRIKIMMEMEDTPNEKH